MGAERADVSGVGSSMPLGSEAREASAEVAPSVRAAAQERRASAVPSSQQSGPDGEEDGGLWADCFSSRQPAMAPAAAAQSAEADAD